MGKGIRAIARTAGGGGGGGGGGHTPSGKTESIHSTPLPAFGVTPDFSPRAQVKRKVTGHGFFFFSMYVFLINLSLNSYFLKVKIRKSAGTGTVVCFA